MRAFLVLATITFLSAAGSRVALADDAPAATPAAPTPVAAQAGTVSTSASPAFNAASVWGIVSLPFGYGIGARYTLPLGIPSLLTKTRFKDAWALDLGVDFLTWSYDALVVGGNNTGYSYNAFIPLVGMMWEFWVNEEFMVYPKIEAGYAVGWYSNTPAGANGLSGGNRFYPSGAVGLFYKIGDKMSLRAELGYTGAKGGIAFMF
jgi:hypothetical protein